MVLLLVVVFALRKVAVLVAFMLQLLLLVVTAREDVLSTSLPLPSPFLVLGGNNSKFLMLHALLLVERTPNTMWLNMKKSLGMFTIKRK
jgi:hypothetical protein